MLTSFNSKIGINITLAKSNVSDKFAHALRRADANGDGVIDASEVVELVEEMLQEQSMKRIYRFLAIGLLIMVAVLIGALSGITYGIVQLSKDTKVSTYSNTNYQFLLTKDGKATVTGSAALDLSGLEVQRDGPSRRRLLLDGEGGGGGARLLAEEDLGNWTYVATLPYQTVAQGCVAVAQNVVEFPVETPFSFLVNGTVINTVKVTYQTGCDGAARNVSALVEADDGYDYLVKCSGAARGCDLWQGSYDDAAAAAGPASGRRLLRQLEAAMRPSFALVGGDGDGAEEEAEAEGAEAAARRRLAEGGGGCFPADATVEVAGRGAVPMAQLRYGDLVRSLDRTSRAEVFRPVFLFGHREAGGARPYVAIGTAAGRTLVATAGHFVPVCVAGCEEREQLRAGAGAATLLENRRAGDVRVGDVVVVAAPSPALTAVTRVEVLMATGAFNPYIRGADLIVDGVLASPHSDWLLDPVAPPPLLPLLPSIYEALLAPVYLLYAVVGPATAEWLAHGLGLAESGASAAAGHAGYWAVLAGMAAPAAAAGLLARGAAKRLARWGQRGPAPHT